ncbi:MAG: OmpA family protein [Bacteroidales bacterium]|nr:OmpA family protein [Bacteroidales bacterium]
MHLYKSIFISLFLLYTHLNNHAQQGSKYLIKADEFYAEQNYNKALKYYIKESKEVGGYSEYCYLQAARCYDKMEEYNLSDQYYNQIFFKSDNVEPSLFLEYGNLLLKIGRSDEARSYFMSYNNLMEKNDPRVLRFISSIEDIDKYYLDSSFVKLSKLCMNSTGEDYNPKLYQDKLLFESSRKYFQSEPLNRDIYFFEKDNPENRSLKNISGKTSNKRNLNGFAIADITGEMLQVITDDDNKKGHLMRSFLEEDGRSISNAEQILIQSFEFKIADPAVNNTGHILVFSAVTDIGSGDWDLYITKRNSYGYEKPELIPGFVNTLGDERYPELINDSILIFASTGHGGLGGYDLYYTNLNKPTTLPKNLGFPLNSNFDDIGLILSEDKSYGYLSSNRDEENSLTDLYYFEISQIRAFGEVTDDRTGDNLKNISIDIKKEGDVNSQFTLADNGRFNIVGQADDKYDLTVWREGYRMKNFEVYIASSEAVGLHEVDMGKYPIEKLPDSEPQSPKPEIFKEPEPEIIEPSVIEEEIMEEPVEMITEKREVLPARGTIFRVQIAASRHPLSENLLKNIYKGGRDIFMFQEEGWYKYAIGEYTSYYEANNLRKSCGVKDAFIAAYKGETKLNLMNAIKEVHISPIQPAKVNKHTGKHELESLLVFFNFDQYKVSKEELNKIDQLLAQYKYDDSVFFEIDGHADIRGSDTYNMGLATERAKYIKEYLISSGIGEERITELSFGEQKLRKFCYYDCSPAVHKANRRAEIIVYKK